MSVFTWGFGKPGNLGNGGNETCHTPVKPRLPGNVKGACIHSGGHCTAVVSDGGELYMFGCGKYGRLGTGDEEDRNTPVRIPIKAEDGDRTVKLKQVSCGSWHGAAVSTDNNVYVWGYGRSHGVLGLTDHAPALAPPTLLNGPITAKVAGVSCGNNFTLLWTTDGESYSWGCGRNGVLGHGDVNDRVVPTAIDAFKSDNNNNIVFMDAGFAHSGAITAQGRVFMFGRGEDLALGLGKGANKQINTPHEVSALRDVVIKMLSCSVGEKHGHTLFADDKGAAYSCGDGYKGKLGMGDQESRAVPTQIPQEHFQGDSITRVAAGGIHSAAISREGHVFTWGCGSDGRLGHPDGKGHRYLFRSDVPRKVDALEEVGIAKELSCSYYHTVALMDAK